MIVLAGCALQRGLGALGDRLRSEVAPVGIIFDLGREARQKTSKLLLVRGSVQAARLGALGVNELLAFRLGGVIEEAVGALLDLVIRDRGVEELAAAGEDFADHHIPSGWHGRPGTRCLTDRPYKEACPLVGLRRPCHACSNRIETMWPPIRVPAN